jgi:succinate dehydrogenase / fumarate reductase flavoprotein subunit
MYPAFGNLVPRDIGAREVLRICEQGLGVGGQSQVYLDVSHLPPETQKKMESVLEIYQKFTGEDPRKRPMKIFPAVHYSMGGAWADWPAADDPDRWTRFRHMTNLKGVFSAGECDYLYHGANRLGANSLLSCIFSGLVTGVEVPRYIATLTKLYADVPEGIFEKAKQKQQQHRSEIMNRQGPENVHALHDELSEWMVKYVTVKRDNPDLEKTMSKLKELRERYQNITLSDKGNLLNQTYVFANQFGPMLELALIITKGALLRNEFRGAHFKPKFPQRNDEEWLKTTIAEYDPKKDEPVISYQPVDMRHLDPIKRDYTHAKKMKPTLKNIPSNIQLPL